jgi:transcriptional regulator with XRE-family HTH domain
MSLVEKVGFRIAQQRRLAGLSQARLAEMLEVEPETLSRLETGKSMPSLTTLEAIAEALEIELRELFRLRSTDTLEDAAIERLVWLVSPRPVTEIELVIDLASRIFAFQAQLAGAGIRHQGTQPAPNTPQRLGGRRSPGGARRRPRRPTGRPPA